MAKKQGGMRVIDYIVKRKYMLDEINLEAARLMVRELPFQQIVAEDIKEIRSKLGLSVQALADFMGVNYHTVYKWEQEHRGIQEYVGLALAGLCFMRIAHDAEKQRLARGGVVPRLERDLFPKKEETEKEPAENTAE